VAKQPTSELVIDGFNYDLLETKVTDKLRSTADRIRDKVKKTLQDIIEVGNDLLAVKDALPADGPELHERGRTVRTENRNNCGL
jgi:hypothetical protein